MSHATLLPNPAELRLDHLISEPNAVTVVVQTTREAVPCPDCQHPSRRVHSHYTRTLADLPWSGVADKPPGAAAPSPARHPPPPRPPSPPPPPRASFPGAGAGVPLLPPPRRFFCSSLTCSRRVFTERLPGTAGRYARRTLRFEEAL